MKPTKTRPVRIVILSLLALTLALPSLADVVQIGASKDNTLFEDAAGARSNGAGAHFFAGVTAQPELRRGLLAFDIAGAVPAGATINSVSLTLNVSQTLQSGQAVTLHRLTSDWGESTSDAPGQEGAGTAAEPGDATWIHTFTPGSFWTNAGGDFARSASDSQIADFGFVTWSSATMASDVQGWLDNPAANFGWALLGDETDIVTAKRFDSRENPDPAVQPMLTIDYSLSDVPASSDFGVAILIGLFLLMGSVFFMRRGAIAQR